MCPCAVQLATIYIYISNISHIDTPRENQMTKKKHIEIRFAPGKDGTIRCSLWACSRRKNGTFESRMKALFTYIDMFYWWQPHTVAQPPLSLISFMLRPTLTHSFYPLRMANVDKLTLIEQMFAHDSCHRKMWEVLHGFSTISQSLLRWIDLCVGRWAVAWRGSISISIDAFAQRIITSRKYIFCTMHELQTISVTRSDHARHILCHIYVTHMLSDTAPISVKCVFVTVKLVESSAVATTAKLRISFTFARAQYAELCLKI